MQKWLLFIVVLLLAISVGVVTASPIDDLNVLASQYSSETLIFASVRTDDEYLASLNSLYQRLGAFLPANADLPPDLLEALDTALAEQGVSPFAESIRPWLGATASLGIQLNAADINDDPLVLVTLAINSEAAEAALVPLLDAQVEAGDFKRGIIGGFTSYTSQTGGTVIAFGSDVLYVSNSPQTLPINASMARLSESADFSETLNRLPESQYNVTVYINTPLLQSIVLQELARSEQAMPEFVEQLLGMNGQQSIGFTLLGDSSLVMDIVQTVNIGLLAEYGVQNIQTSPIDFEFTNRIPADAPLMGQFSDFGGQTAAAFSNLRAIGDAIKANGGLANLIDPSGREFSSIIERNVVNQIDPALLLGALNLSFAGATGVSLEREVLPVLDGDLAIYARTVPIADFISPILPDVAFLFQTSDSAASQALVERFGAAAEAYGTSWKLSAYGDGNALVIPAAEYLSLPIEQLDLLVAASGGVFAIGTRGATQAALDTSGGLADSETFQTASALFLPNTQGLLYFNTTPIFDAVDELILAGLARPSASDLEGYTALSALQSGSITYVSTPEGQVTVRAVLTLSTTPRIAPSISGNS